MTSQPGAGTTVAVRLPLPPSCLPTLYEADDRFKEAYLGTFEGFYSTADAGMVDEEGYVSVMSRTVSPVRTRFASVSMTGRLEATVVS